MKEFAFHYRGKTYRGFMAISTEEYPHYYWCYLEDPELVHELGDCISFKIDAGGRLQSTEPYPEPYHELLETLKQTIARDLVPGILT